MLEGPIGKGPPGFLFWGKRAGLEGFWKKKGRVIILKKTNTEAFCQKGQGGGLWGEGGPAFTGKYSIGQGEKKKNKFFPPIAAGVNWTFLCEKQKKTPLFRGGLFFFLGFHRILKKNLTGGPSGRGSFGILVYPPLFFFFSFDFFSCAKKPIRDYFLFFLAGDLGGTIISFPTFRPFC